MRELDLMRGRNERIGTRRDVWSRNHMGEKRVLLVDDDAELTDILHDYLEDNGLQVTEAGSARQALHLLKHSGPYDLVLLDIGLPDLDGLAVLERLRLDGYDLPVVMATAESNSLKVRRARQLGVSAYLLKPFDLDRLVQIVDRLLAA